MRGPEDYLNPNADDGPIESVEAHGQETKMEVWCRECKRRSFTAEMDMLEYDKENGEYECKCGSHNLVWVCTGTPLNALKRDELRRLRNNYHLGLAVQNDGTAYPCGEAYDNPGPETGTRCHKCKNPMYNG